MYKVFIDPFGHEHWTTHGPWFTHTSCMNSYTTKKLVKEYLFWQSCHWKHDRCTIRVQHILWVIIIFFVLKEWMKWIYSTMWTWSMYKKSHSLLITWHFKARVLCLVIVYQKFMYSSWLLEVSYTSTYIRGFSIIEKSCLPEETFSFRTLHSRIGKLLWVNIVGLLYHLENIWTLLFTNIKIRINHLIIRPDVKQASDWVPS